jgi:N-acyl-D-amino-acid deacylase
MAARQRIDAEGLVISPGFVDIHAHSGLMALAEKSHEAKVLQGVTTELVGVDGLSYAPFRSKEDLLAMVRMNSGVDGDPPLDYSWGTVTEYLDLFDRDSPVNVALLVGNTPLRINALGWSDVPSTSSATADMRAMLRTAMEEGAFGLSTGLDYPPGCFADTQELIDLASEAADLGGIYHTHVRYSLGDRYLDPYKEGIEIGKKSGVAVHLTHLAPRNSYPSAQGLLRLVESAAAEGLDITFDAIPLYPGSTRILILFPHWVQEGGPQELLARLGDPSVRARLKDEVGPGADVTWDDMWLTNFTLERNRNLSGLTAARIAELRSQHPVDMLCDLLVEEELRVTFSYMNADLRNLPRFLAHPHSMAASDAVLLGEHPPQRTFATFVSMLSDYSRDEPVMSLPEAIRKMTSMPAQRIGISDRGILRDGLKADLVVFDPNRAGSKATRANARQRPDGILHVIVNGVLTVENAKRTSANPGHALRRRSYANT